MNRVDAPLMAPQREAGLGCFPQLPALPKAALAEVSCQEESMTIRSSLPTIEMPSILLPEFIRECVDRDGVWNKPASIDGPSGRGYTFGEILTLSQAVAGGLHDRGVRRGDVIMMLMPNVPEYAILFLGIASAGAIVTPSNPLYTGREICRQIDDSGASLIVTTGAFVDKLHQAGVHIPTICCGPALNGTCAPFAELLSSGTKGDAVLPCGSPDDVLILPYSSGTTGLAKGVQLTHRNVVSNLMQVLEGPDPAMLLRRDDVLLGVLPFFHIYGLVFLVLAHLVRRIPLVLIARFDAKTMLGAIQKYRVTVAPVVPPILLELARRADVADYDLTSLRVVMTAAASLPSGLADVFRAKLGLEVSQNYGMTETGPTFMTRDVSGRPERCTPGAVGSVLPNTEAKIQDPGTGVTLPRYRVGELCVRGPQVMKGYLSMPKETSALVDGEGWLHTGDLAYVNDREELFIVARLKEIIKYKGYQVAPAELEALLMQHESVQDAAVVGVPDFEAGEVPVAYVELKDGLSATEQEILDFVKERVVHYKRLRFVEFTEHIPRSPSGKVLRNKLKETSRSFLQKREQYQKGAAA